MKKLCLLFSLIFLSSCSDFYQQFDQTDLHQLVGQSQSEVTKKLGAPTYTLIDKEETKLIYQTHYKTYSNPERQTYLNPSTLQQGTFNNNTCTTSFTIKEKIVTAVHTTGTCL